MAAPARDCEAPQPPPLARPAASEGEAIIRAMREKARTLRDGQLPGSGSQFEHHGAKARARAAVAASAIGSIALAAAGKAPGTLLMQAAAQVRAHLGRLQGISALVFQAFAEKGFKEGVTQLLVAIGVPRSWITKVLGDRGMQQTTQQLERLARQSMAGPQAASGAAASGAAGAQAASLGSQYLTALGGQLALSAIIQLCYGAWQYYQLHKDANNEAARARLAELFSVDNLLRTVGVAAVGAAGLPLGWTLVVTLVAQLVALFAVDSLLVWKNNRGGWWKALASLVWPSPAPALQPLSFWLDPHDCSTWQGGAPVDVTKGLTLNGMATGIEEFICPIKGFLAVDPVYTIYGHVFERQCLMDLFDRQSRPLCPITRRPLCLVHVYPFEEAKRFIDRVAEGQGWEVHLD